MNVGVRIPGVGRSKECDKLGLTKLGKEDGEG